jgi:hypothetical protein
MIARPCHLVWLLLTVVFIAAPDCMLSAQPQTATISQPVNPPLPVLKPPVDFFRELLAMTSADREQSLAQRPVEIRQRILDKVQEYEAMKPEERELRLRATQLRWYLRSLMEMPANGRAAQLALVPEADRALVGQSLRQWDRLPHDQQQEILKYEKAMDEFVLRRIKGSPSNDTSPGMNPPLPPDPFKNVGTFLKLPAEQRQKLYASFDKFFELSAAEQDRTLAALPPAQRSQMANALAFFGRLPKASREQFLNTLDKFSSMSEAERQAFLGNAERWRELAPAQRDAWRSFVNRVPPLPPLPMGVAFPPQTSLQASEPAKAR